MKRKILVALAAAVTLLGAGLAGCSASPGGGSTGGSSQSVTWYSGFQATDAQPIIDAFKAKTGISVNFLTGTTADLEARLQQELAAGRPTADVINLTDYGFVQQLQQANELSKIPADISSGYPQAYVDPNGYYFSTRVTVIPIAYNTNLVKGADIPTTWTDLLKPFWKGDKIVLGSAHTNNTNFISDWQMAQKYGDSFLTQLGQQGVSILPHSGDEVNAVLSGQYAAAIVSDDAAWPQIENGAPIALSYPTDGVGNYVDYNAAINGTGGNPAAAQQFLDFLSSPEAGALLAKTGAYSTAPDVAVTPSARPALSTLNLFPSDAATVQKWVAAKNDYLDFLATSLGDH